MDIPEGYGIVESQVYRSAMLQHCNYSLFNNIKTIILLSAESPTKALLQWIADSNIQLVHLGLQQLVRLSSGSWRPVSEELIKEGLEILLNVDMHPVLIMCTTGVQETGCLVGCLRKLQNWNFNSIIVEYRSFAGNKSRYNVEQFIELFDTDLVTLPQKLPSWFVSPITYPHPNR
ncbi:protein-tyrosine phosphatase [Globomyces pollinis-pini]|nr:protein-tyrosine phosphatase [Globomyces pollinis-pini]